MLLVLLATICDKDKVFQDSEMTVHLGDKVVMVGQVGATVHTAVATVA